MSGASSARCSTCGHSAGVHDRDGCCAMKDRKLCTCAGFTGTRVIPANRPAGK